MRSVVLLSLLSFVYIAHAGSEQNEQLRPMLVKAITNESKILQLLVKCEAPADLVKKMSDTTMSDLKAFRESDTDGAAAFEAAFQEGKEAADELYQTLGKDANSSATCQQAEQLANIGMGL